jgi:adenine phosphoribosyltransferase
MSNVQWKTHGGYGDLDAMSFCIRHSASGIRDFLPVPNIDPATELKSKIRTVRDWPKPGVNFRDVTTLFAEPEAFRILVESIAWEATRLGVNLIAAVDARGFILGGALAYQLHRPFMLVRKKGKLPHTTVGADYALEYGSASIEIHADACKPGDRVFIVDDLIATGGTVLAAASLIRSLGAEVVGVAAIIDLPELGGSDKLRAAGLRVQAVCSFSEAE